MRGSSSSVCTADRPPPLTARPPSDALLASLLTTAAFATRRHCTGNNSFLLDGYQLHPVLSLDTKEEASKSTWRLER